MFYRIFSDNSDLLNDYYSGWWQRGCDHDDECECQRKHSHLSEEEVDKYHAVQANIQRRYIKLKEILERKNDDRYVVYESNIQKVISALTKENIEYDLLYREADYKEYEIFSSHTGIMFCNLIQNDNYINYNTKFEHWYNISTSIKPNITTTKWYAFDSRHRKIYFRDKEDFIAYKLTI